ncbi:MAG: glycosyltransferase family 2 protein [Planctomycetota bacterium]
MPAATPLLSIVTPSLNQGRYLGECLDSVRREIARVDAEFGEPGSVEHIVMDGGSTDATVGLLERAAHLAHWQSEPDGGQSAAINAGLLHHARGEFATWLNADDWLEEGALAPMLGRLRDADAPDVLVGRCRFVRDGETIFEPRPPEPIDAAGLLRLRSGWFNGRLIVQPEAFFRLACFRAVGGLNDANHFTMDHELWLTLLRAGARFESIEHRVACMRAHDEQKTADNRCIVASLIEFGEPFLDDITGASERDRAAREIEGMRRKLALSGPVLRRLRSLWADTEPASAAEPRPLEASAGFHNAPLRAALQSLPSPPRLIRRRWRVPPGTVLPGVRTTESRDGPHDLIHLRAALHRSDDPAGVASAAWASLRAGGVLVVSAEIAPCGATLRGYCGRLASLIDQQLSQDHDWIVDADAMDWVRSLEGSTDADDAALLGAIPGLLGNDVRGLLPVEPLAFIRYGGVSWHPLVPFEAVESVQPAADEHCWCCGLWHKPH